MLVQGANRRIAKQDAAATVGLQAMLVRVHDDGIRLDHGIEMPARFCLQIANENEVATVGGIDVQPEPIAVAQLDNVGQRVDRAEPRGAQRRHYGPDATAPQPVLQRVHPHSPGGIGWHRVERQLQHPAQALMGVMGLLRGEHEPVGFQRPANPQRFQIGHCSAAGEMAEMGRPAKHGRQLRHGLPLHLRAGAAPVQRVVVGVDEHRQFVRKPSYRVRRLEHLPRV